MLVVAARAWNGCPACVRIACVRRADGGPLTVTVDSGGGGDCAAIGVAGAWASVPWSAAPVAFTPGRALDVPTECR